MKRDILEEILAARSSRRRVVLWTWLDGSRHELVDLDATDGMDAKRATGLPEERAVVEKLWETSVEASNSDRATVCEVDAASILVQPLNPPLRMHIVGAVHIGQHLAVMAASAGYDVTVIDPRSSFATPDRFPGIRISHEWPDAALGEIGLDSRTAVVTLTHDPKLDDPALLAALGSSVFYIGSLGSRRTQARRLDRLRAQGVEEAELRRIHGPVGLDIQARTPAEIAISTLAQVTACLREMR